MSKQIARKIVCIGWCLCLSISSFAADPLIALAARQPRNCSHLSEQQREFAEQLCLQNRKYFCGRFNDVQRQTAMRYAEEGITLAQSQIYLLSPDDAVQRVREESGMSMAVKRQRECEEE